MNTIGEGKPWRFSHFRKTNGYANMPLDGLWLRAPYLHNGSVPTLRALLFPEERPAVFYRGYDVYDWTQRRVRRERSGGRGRRRSLRHRRSRATATPDMSTARRCRDRSASCSSNT